jgi:serine/threonine-protein kinase
MPSIIVIETDPPGAEVSLDGRPRGASPVTLSETRAGEHFVEASLAGRQTVKKTVSVKAEGEQFMMVLSLPVAGAPAGEVKAVVDVKRPDAPQKGKLSLKTEPWTHVTLNGKALGDTPLIEFPMPAGRHVLKLTNEQEKVDTNIEVEVRPGQVTKKVLRL